MTDDLVQFLRARLDEDEQAARIGDATEPPLTFRQIGDTGVIVASNGTHAEECANGNWAGVAEHIVRHDPARVLAEVEAKRQIIAEHDTLAWKIGDRVHDCQWLPDWPCRTLRLLALPYADHPDYREEWKP